MKFAGLYPVEWGMVLVIGSCLATVVLLQEPRQAAAAPPLCPDPVMLEQARDDLQRVRVELETQTKLLTQIRDGLRKR